MQDLNLNITKTVNNSDSKTKDNRPSSRRYVDNENDFDSDNSNQSEEGQNYNTQRGLLEDNQEEHQSRSG